MLIQKNSLVKKSSKKHWLLTGAFLLLIILGSKIDLDFGGIVLFTLQTLFLGLAYYYLPLPNRVTLISLYLLLGIVGLPVFNGGIGSEYVLSYPLGFFVGFVVSAFVPVNKSENFSQSLLYFMVVHVVILSLGVLWLLQYDSLLVAAETAKSLSIGMVVKSLTATIVVVLVSKTKNTLD